MRSEPVIRFVYSTIGIAITPLLKLWLARRARRGKELAARTGERFGHASIARPTGTLLWLHAASVGETQSVLTLVHALLAHRPSLHLLITTGTVTSAALVAQQSLPQVIHQFVPVDTAPAVRRFLRHWRPDLALWVESEFWPQLLWQTHARHIPMLLINARVSARSLQGWKRWPHTIRHLLGAFTALYAGSTEDAARLRTLGADANRVHDIGNLKYDAAPLPINQALLAELSQSCQARHVWVAASTHANEEMTIAGVHQSLLQQFPDLLTIIIPRHASRGNTIAGDLRACHAAFAQRSKHEPITAATGIYLADTMGELGSFYRVADIVFLGGSLIAHGGHNPLEPARLTCALITGPHTHNFAAIIDHLQTADAIRVVQDKEALRTTLAELFTDDALRLTLAERAAAVTLEARGAGEIILQQVDALLSQRQEAA